MLMLSLDSYFLEVSVPVSLKLAAEAYFGSKSKNLKF